MATGCDLFKRLLKSSLSSMRATVVAGRQGKELLAAEGHHPAAVEVDNGLFRIQHLEDLLPVGLGILRHLLPGQGLAGGAAAGWVPDQTGEVADQEDDRVAQVLEAPHAAQHDRVTQVQVRRCRVESGLDAQWPSGFYGANQPGSKLFRSNQLGDSLLQKAQLFLNGHGFQNRRTTLRPSRRTSSRTSIPIAWG